VFTIDANIFVRDANPYDTDYAICHTLLERLYIAQFPIIAPTILLAEVAGPISRAFRDPMRARLYVQAMAALPNVTLILCDAALAQDAAEIAADYALRGMDAIYVAVARRHRCVLVTLDDEPRQRVSAIIPTRTPTEALAELP
jgi:predicted nucleic acid-binding protein